MPMTFGEDLLRMSVDVYVGTTNNDHAIYAREMLKDENFEVVVAEENVLMLDYDDVEDLPEQFYTSLGILESVLGVAVRFEQSRSKSGTGIHVLVFLPESMPIITRVAWQAAFGSDPKREALHLLSIARREKNPILLYNRKKPEEQKPLGDGQ